MQNLTPRPSPSHSPPTPRSREASSTRQSRLRLLLPACQPWGEGLALARQGDLAWQQQHISILQLVLFQSKRGS